MAQSFTATIASTGAVQLPQSIRFVSSGTANRSTVINIPPDATLVIVYFETNDGHVDLRQATVDNDTITPASDNVLPVESDGYFSISIDDGRAGRSRVKQIAISATVASTVVRAYVEGRQG